MDSTDNTMKMIMTTVLLVTLVHVNYVNLLMDGSDHLVQNVQKTIILFQSDQTVKLLITDVTGTMSSLILKTVKKLIHQTDQFVQNAMTHTFGIQFKRFVMNALKSFLIVISAVSQMTVELFVMNAKEILKFGNKLENVMNLTVKSKLLLESIRVKIARKDTILTERLLNAKTQLKKDML